MFAVVRKTMQAHGSVTYQQDTRITDRKAESSNLAGVIASRFVPQRQGPSPENIRVTGP